MIPLSQLKNYSDRPWMSEEDIESFRKEVIKCCNCDHEAVILDQGEILDKDGELLEEDVDFHFCWDCYKEWFNKSDLSQKEIDDHLTKVEKDLRKNSLAFTRYLKRIRSIRPANQTCLAAFLQKQQRQKKRKQFLKDLRDFASILFLPIYIFSIFVIAIFAILAAAASYKGDDHW